MFKDKIEQLKEKRMAMKNVLKLKTHTAKRYKYRLDLLRNNTIEEDDLDLFCQFEPSILTTVNFIKDKQNKQEAREFNKEILERDLPLIEKNIQEAKEELALIEEEQNKAAAIECLTFEEIESKREKIKYITKRLEITQKTLFDYINIKESLFPKKKPGRPKKEKEKTMREQLFENAVENKKINRLQILQLEENIFAAVKNLKTEQKEYIYEHILKMLEVEQNVKEIKEVVPLS